ncbi:MAG: hypothetical protein CL923_05205 [Deltaproteobacteria bacterium]|nr:hypothetical protein [Deltaproteobacteria bacterium]
MMTLVSNDGGVNWAAGNDNVSIDGFHDNGSSENWIPSPESVVYDSSNSRYVAVGKSSLGWTIISSTNGSTWSKLSTIDNSTRPLYGDPQLITGGSKLLLVGSQEKTYGYCYSSTYGYHGNWPECESPARMMTLVSNDGGVNWAAGNDNVKVNIRYQTQERLQQGPYVFGKREYLMATGNEVKHQEGDAVVIAASQDGFSWTQYSLIPKVVLKAPVTHLAYGNRRYVLISSRPQQRVYKYVEGYGNTQVLEPDLMQTLVSDNGSDWTTGNRGVEILSATGWQPIAPNNISFLGGKFYSYDSDMAIRSTDGIDWEVVPLEAEESQDGEGLENVAFGNGVFVALVSVANYNYCYWSWPHYGSGHWPECGGSKESIFYHSTNGENWTVVSFASSSDNVTVASSSDNATVDNVTNNKIVVFFEQVGNGGYNVIKPELVDIKFGNGHFIAWDNRTAVVSTDGQNWTLHSITVPTINNSAGYPVSEFVMSFDNQTVYGEPQGALTPPSSDGKPRVVRIGPSGNPETGSSNYVSRSRAKKVFVTFSEPVTIGKTGDSTSWSGTESCTNFDVQYHREGESNCYQLNAAPTTLGTNFTAGGKVFNKTWVFDFGQEPNCCSTHEIRVKASPTLTDQQGNSLAEDFVTRIRF